MKKYVAYLRAINVGGTSIIKMDDLRRMFESFGFSNVQTCIQSGNVIFASSQWDGGSLETKLESRLEEALGWKVGVFIRTWEENDKLAKQSLFEVGKDETLHIVFLREKPPKQTEQNLLSFNSPADEFAAKGREIYNLRCDRDKSVFSNNFIEKIVKAPATTRNWNTICKIAEKYK